MDHPPRIKFVYIAGQPHGREAGTEVEAPAHVAHPRFEQGFAQPASEEDQEAYEAWLEAEGLDVPEALLEIPEEEAEPEPEPEEEAEPEPEPEEAGDVAGELPEDFPARDKLTGAGLETVEDVAAAVDDLEDIKGVGPATKEAILTALTGLGAGE